MKKLHIAIVVAIAALLLAINADAEQLRIAAWNIQVFGQAKAAKPGVMRVIAETIREFDVVAVQEVRDRSGLAIQELERRVNAGGGNYAVVAGPRLGRTNSKEQYCYFVNLDKIKLTSTVSLPDTEDVFHREPFVARFTTIGTVPFFTFTMAVVHTDPDEARQEIPALFSVALPAIRLDSSISDEEILLAGDYNADCTYFDERRLPVLARRTGLVSLIGNELDTTVGRTVCTYDRMVATPELAAHVVGEGVYIGEITGEVSDHYPVFVVIETGGE